MASARQDLLAAEAAERQASVELGRLIHDDVSRPLAVAEAGMEEPLKWIASAHTQRYLDTPAKWTVFREFILAQAREHSPEIKRVDELLAGQAREVTSSRRAFYIPDLAAVGIAANQFSRSGVGSEPSPLTPNNTAWSVGIQATIPIFSGGALRARLSESKHQLRQLDAQRAATFHRIRQLPCLARRRLPLTRTTPRLRMPMPAAWSRSPT